MVAPGTPRAADGRSGYYTLPARRRVWRHHRPYVSSRHTKRNVVLLVCRYWHRVVLLTAADSPPPADEHHRIYMHATAVGRPDGPSGSELGDVSLLARQPVGPPLACLWGQLAATHAPGSQHAYTSHRYRRGPTHHGVLSRVPGRACVPGTPRRCRPGARASSRRPGPTTTDAAYLFRPRDDTTDGTPPPPYPWRAAAVRWRQLFGACAGVPPDVTAHRDAAGPCAHG